MKNDKLTLLLVLKGRHHFTDRWLEYANIFLNEYKILIADGSEENDKYILQKNKYKNLEIKSPHFPHDKNIEFFLNKIKNSLEFIDTEYVLYCENDDLMISDEIKNVLFFLQTNKDYVSGRGEIFNFSISSLKEVYGKIIEFKRFNNFVHLSESNVFDRLNSYSKNKHGLYHNITKKYVLRKILEETIKNKFFNLVVFQYFWNFFIPITGKIYCSKNLYMLHQDHFDMSSKNTDIMSFDKSFFYYEKYFDNFFQNLAKEIKNEYNIEINEARSKLLSFFSFNELLSIISQQNKKDFTLKKWIINLMRNYKISNFLLNYKKRFVVNNNQFDENKLKTVQDFLIK